jgi:hypothetical protein
MRGGTERRAHVYRKGWQANQKLRMLDNRGNGLELAFRKRQMELE